MKERERNDSGACPPYNVDSPNVVLPFSPFPHESSSYWALRSFDLTPDLKRSKVDVATCSAFLVRNNMCAKQITNPNQAKDVALREIIHHIQSTHTHTHTHTHG